VNKILSLLKSTQSWLILLPLFLVLAGAASNQAVLIANHGKFPVMLNERQQAQFSAKNDIDDARENAIKAIRAAQATADIADENRKNDAVQVDQVRSERAAKAAVTDYQEAVEARTDARFDRMRDAVEKSKVDRDAAIAAEKKAEEDANTVAKSTTDSKKELPKEVKATPKKNFNILHTAVRLDDIQGQFLDSVHSVMGPNSRLKALADVFDLGDGIYSVGDFGIILGAYFWPFTSLLFLALNALKFSKLKQVGYGLLGMAAISCLVELLPYTTLAIIFVVGIIGALGYGTYLVGKALGDKEV
jgi:hypothetical protein